MNRKLIRPNLSDVKGKERELQRSGTSQENKGDGSATGQIRRQLATQNAASTSAPIVSTSTTEPLISKNQNRRQTPPVETNAEIYYYKKQIDSHTVMVIVLNDGEEIQGTIEWYDRNALKVNRKNAPNIMLLKHNIKYMFKAEDRS